MKLKINKKPACLLQTILKIMDKLTYTDPTSDFRFKRILAVSLIKICSSLLLTNCSRDVRQSPLPSFKLPFKPFNSLFYRGTLKLIKKPSLKSVSFRWLLICATQTGRSSRTDFNSQITSPSTKTSTLNSSSKNNFCL